MATKLFMGNLSWDVTDEVLQEAVARYGRTISARVMTDRDTGRSRGFGFVEVEDADAQNVISGLNGQSLMGRPLTVNLAREREPRSGGDRGGYGGGRSGGGRRY